MSCASPRAPATGSRRLPPCARAARGPGLHVIGVPADGDPVLGGRGRRPRRRTGRGRGGSSRLRPQAHPALRRAAGVPASLLVAAAPAAIVAALRERGLAPYVDQFVAAGVADRDHGRSRGAAAAGPFIVRVLPRRTPRPRASRRRGRSCSVASRGPGARSRSRVELWRGPAACLTYLNPRTLDLAGVTASCPLPGAVTSDMLGAAIERIDLGSASVFLVHAGEGDRFAAGVDVAAARALTVEEIIARHQAAAAWQAARIGTADRERNMALTFEAPGFVAPITITSDTTIYQDAGRGTTDIRQANIRVNGVSFTAGGGVRAADHRAGARLRAAARDHAVGHVRYRLAGRESIPAATRTSSPSAARRRRAALQRARLDRHGDVRHRPRRRGTDGAQGRDNRVGTGGRLRAGFRGSLAAGAVRRAPDLRGRERAHADPSAPGSPARHERRGLPGAPGRGAGVDGRHAARYGRGIPISDPGRRTEETEDGGRKTEAEDGRRKTEDGRRKTEGRRRSPPMPGLWPACPTVSGPSLRRPRRSEHLAAAAVRRSELRRFRPVQDRHAVQRVLWRELRAARVPRALDRGTRWQLAGRAFGIVSSYNDRAFVAGREVYPLDIRQRPAQAAIWALRPLSARTALRIAYDWDYNRYARHEVTAPDFVIPRNQNAHAIRIGLDGQLAGWQGSVWGSYRSGLAGARGACRRSAPRSATARRTTSASARACCDRRRCRRA